MIQYNSLVLRSRCFRSVEMWQFQVSLLSRCSPMYLTASAWGMLTWLKMSCGQFPLLSEKVTCFDFSSFIFIFHLRVHFSMLWRLVCKFAEAVMGFEWLDRMAVSSANVLRIVFGDWGMSAM